jgi:hypothetical protein
MLFMTSPFQNAAHLPHANRTDGGFDRPALRSRSHRTNTRQGYARVCSRIRETPECLSCTAPRKRGPVHGEHNERAVSGRSAGTEANVSPVAMASVANAGDGGP